MLSVLKMSFILLFLTLFQAVATNSYSQSVTISVKTDQAPLTDLFAIIEKQSDFLFFYVDSDVKNVKVSVNATDKSIENILSQALRNTSLKYSIEGRNINVFNKNIVAQQTKKRITGLIPHSSFYTLHFWQNKLQQTVHRFLQSQFGSIQ